jgi:toxin ParE1/3/4
MKLRFTPRALENISAIADYIRFRNPAAGAACSICDLRKPALQDLILFPRVGRLQQTQGVRKFVTPRYAYLIYYTVDDAAWEIIILSVKHSAQKRDHEDTPSALGR